MSKFVEVKETTENLSEYILLDEIAKLRVEGINKPMVITIKGSDKQMIIEYIEELHEYIYNNSINQS